jgi:hypothetical protein
MTIYYAAVEDDPLTSGNGGRVHVHHKVGTIQGQDGQARQMAFIGDPAWCVACQSMGTIVGGAPVPDNRRMLDLVNGGRRQAVGGDEVACKCASRPRIIAVYGQKFMITGVNVNNAVPVAKPAVTNGISAAVFDEKVILQDRNGSPLPDTFYTIKLPSGDLRHGITDSQGRTARYATNGAHNISIYPGHHQDAQ